jgi:hypothetical protein
MTAVRKAPSMTAWNKWAAASVNSNHHLAFAITMHSWFRFILTIFCISGSVGKITGNNNSPVEGFRCESKDQYGGCQLLEHTGRALIEVSEK